MGDDRFSGAIDWIAGVLTGSVGTSVAIIAVAYCGFQMLSGRLPTRRMAQVVAGCVLIFAAGPIAQGLMVTLLGLNPAPPPPPPSNYAPPPPPVASPPSGGYDPYAGASLGRPSAPFAGGSPGLPGQPQPQPGAQRPNQ